MDKPVALRSVPADLATAPPAEPMPAIYVIVATKGRAEATATLCAFLARQTAPIAAIHIVGSNAGDVAGLAELRLGLNLTVIVAGAAGASYQRNRAIAALFDGEAAPADDDLVVFFDDDYRPADNWLENAAQFMAAAPDIVGMTGTVLADGVKTAGLSEADAVEYLAGHRPPQEHWASWTAPREVTALYGCNMAVRARALRAERFDENLPLYSWQEDLDLSGRIVRLGRVVYTPVCRGVHLGSKSGRTSGVRLGYSQIANPVYLARKGSCPTPRALRFVGRALIGNAARSTRTNELFDFRGRFRGNLIALADLIRGRIDPRRILEL